MEWYYILGMISYGIFIAQFILSSLGIGDVDLDVDFDGITDFNISDLVSFKGLVHFLMGFSGWLMITGKVTTATIMVAILIGFTFMLLLYFVYVLCMKLQSESTIIQGKNLVGENVTVYCVLPENRCICYLMKNEYQEIPCECTTPVKEGEIRRIVSFESGKYRIS